MKLFLVHCGFYDMEIQEGVYESHVNFFVAAESFEDARIRAKQHPDFKTKKMHVDGLQEISVIDGWKVTLERSADLEGKTVVVSHRHRDLASKPVTAP